MKQGRGPRAGSPALAPALARGRRFRGASTCLRTPRRPAGLQTTPPFQRHALVIYSAQRYLFGSPGGLQWAFISSRMGYGSCRDVNRRAVKAESHPECVPLSALLLGEPDPASRTQTRLPVKPELQTTRESLFGTRIAHAILIQKYIYIFVVYPKFVFCWASCILSLWKGKDTEVL